MKLQLTFSHVPIPLDLKKIQETNTVSTLWGTKDLPVFLIRKNIATLKSHVVPSWSQECCYLRGLPN